jgi:alpha-amylase
LTPGYWLKATYIAPTTVIPVTFTVDSKVKSGYQVYVSGDVTDLGNWKPANSFLLNSSGTAPNLTWSGEIALPPSSTFTYKYVKWNGKTAVWESTADRTLTTPASGTLDQNDGSF